MKITEIPAKPKEQKITRVAAYARVSSDKDAAFHSLEAQTEYYEDYVAAHPDWELVSIYSDNGISGTITKRPEFQRMLEDCRAGKIDLVVTKSVTRFARNTVVLLETVRELKKLGVDCYFEKEDMHSISPDGELLLTLLAMYAEEEARSASENQLWRIKKKFENGEPWVGNMLGYRLVDGKMVIIPEEAEIVRQIFSDYLSGMGKYRIVKKLIENNVSPESGNTWAVSSISKILSNEKYTGKMLLQKTYRKDFRTKIPIDNRGEKRKYLVNESHEAIIDQETFDLAQQEMAIRAEKYHFRKDKITTSTHLFCGVLHCGNCGSCLKYYRTNAKKYDKAVWVCPRFYTLGKTICASRKIPEDILIAKTKEALSVEVVDRNIITSLVKDIVATSHYSLIFILKDNTTVEVPWQHRSRKESWTTEMRQAARERTIAQRKERGKNAKSDNH